MRRTEQDTEQVRRYFIKQNYPIKHVKIGNKNLDFFVLPRGLNPELENFAFVCLGDSPEDKVIGVSADIPEQFQPYWAFHEETEYIDMGEHVKGRCLSALLRELAVLPIELSSTYVPLRAQFFIGLVEYAKARPKEYSEEQILEFIASRNHLAKFAVSSPKGLKTLISE